MGPSTARWRKGRAEPALIAGDFVTALSARGRAQEGAETLDGAVARVRRLDACARRVADRRGEAGLGVQAYARRRELLRGVADEQLAAGGDLETFGAQSGRDHRHACGERFEDL